MHRAYVARQSAAVSVVRCRQKESAVEQLFSLLLAKEAVV
jgi:hypothetical protein